MLKWKAEVIANNHRCCNCGAAFLKQNGEPRGVIVMRNGKGHCINCGALVCEIKDVTHKCKTPNAGN